ncbi:helix-turn-helix transcriptional regulator [Petroclostridium sp. X23]|uniref:helix-turn-helix domain-containing protein n=1 Tax=Petroclostridium sp. X23 TaxID=3045146 RepID=UPI0024ACBCD9|nr:helix-turn-helix transcriptional regulator [Petroclostridium sp. X23]WHH61601.1 helix-turn-helix transcriptional regulator [Petroclostridium sp. X23]
MRKKRKGLKLSSKKFSEIAGVSKSYIDYIENGQREPSAEKLALLSQALDVPLDVLLEKQIEDKKYVVVNVMEEQYGKEFVESYRDLMSSIDKKDNNLSITTDPEITEILEQLHKRPEMKMLFSVSKNATKEDIEKAVKIIEALKGD